MVSGVSPGNLDLLFQVDLPRYILKYFFFLWLSPDNELSSILFSKVLKKSPQHLEGSCISAGMFQHINIIMFNIKEITLQGALTQIFPLR